MARHFPRHVRNSQSSEQGYGKRMSGGVCIMGQVSGGRRSGGRSPSLWGPYVGAFVFLSHADSKKVKIAKARSYTRNP